MFSRKLHCVLFREKKLLFFYSMAVVDLLVNTKNLTELERGPTVLFVSIYVFILTVVILSLKLGR